jgi:hypothetical protein
VTLEDGFLKRQVAGVEAYDPAIADDDLLRGFRRQVGRRARGRDLGGWCSDDVFHNFGRVLSGLSRLHSAAGDAACRDKVNVLIAEWAKCIERRQKWPTRMAKRWV